MKYCITCGKSNLNRFFTGNQCDECYFNNPVVSLNIKTKELLVKCWDCGKKYHGTTCSCKAKKYRLKKQPHIKLKRIKQKEEIIPICKFCGKEESSDNPFLTSVYFSEKKNKTITKKYHRHISCAKKHNSERLKIKKESCLKTGRIKKTISDIPEKSTCVKCGEQKHISQFYIYKKVYVKRHCKSCHYEIVKKWTKEHQDKVKEYMREYHKNYIRPEKRK